MRTSLRSFDRSEQPTCRTLGDIRRVAHGGKITWRREGGSLASLAALVSAGSLSSRESDALAAEVHTEHAHLQAIADLHDVARVLHEPVGQLRDVHEAVLVHA